MSLSLNALCNSLNTFKTSVRQVKSTLWCRISYKYRGARCSASGLTLSKFVASQAHKKTLLFSPPKLSIHSPSKRKELRGLFQIQNCVNLVAWVHEAVQGKRGEDSVWRISPGPGGLHLAPCPPSGYCDLLYELSTWSPWLPRGPGLLWPFKSVLIFMHLTFAVCKKKTKLLLTLSDWDEKERSGQRICHVSSFCSYGTSLIIKNSVYQARAEVKTVTVQLPQRKLKEKSWEFQVLWRNNGMKKHLIKINNKN